MEKNTQASISVFFPCFNDEKSIGKLVKDAYYLLSKTTKQFEIIVVDDGSKDGSRKKLEKLREQYKNLKLVFHNKNMGYGAALRTGFQMAGNELIFYTDGDGQYDVLELPNLLNLMTRDVNLINGIKMTRHDPTYRIFIGNIYSFIARWLFWLPIYDVDCDFRLIRKSLLDKLDLKSSGGAICIELVKKAQRNGAKFRQVSVHHFERKFGHSQFFQVKYILRTFWELATLWIQLMVLDKFLKR